MNYAKASFLKDVSMTLNLEGYDRNVNITGNTIQDILMSYGRSACPNLKSFYKKASNSNKTKLPTSFIPTYIFCMARVWLPWGFTTLTKKREASACWWNFTFCDIFISLNNQLVMWPNIHQMLVFSRVLFTFKLLTLSNGFYLLLYFQILSMKVDP